MSVRRPARRRGIELTVGELDRVAARRREEPQLIPLPTMIAAVDDARAVARPVGARLPRRLLEMQLARSGAGAGFHAPDAARAVDPPAIRHEDELAPIGRPRWREVVVEDTVVVARETAVPVLGDALHAVEPNVTAARPRRRGPIGSTVRRLCVVAPDGGHEDVPAGVERRRHEGEALAIGRPSRLEVDP